MLIRAVTLEGAGDGLLYYVIPRWDVLITPGPWIDAASQIFFAYSIGCGALPALGSYNKFHHNAYRLVKPISVHQVSRKSLPTVLDKSKIKILIKAIRLKEAEVFPQGTLNK